MAKKTDRVPMDPDSVGITVRLDVEPPPEPKKPRSRAKKEPKRVNLPPAEESDRRYEQLLQEMNHSELVEACRLAGLKADRTMPQSKLRDALRTGVLSYDKPSFIWKMRDELQDYLDSHPKVAVNPKVCPKDCALHPDLIVVQCYRSTETIRASAKSSDVRKKALERSSRMGPKKG
jgi:hypothetical protein